MSELNIYHHELRPDEYDEFYLKYEADEVISTIRAERDEYRYNLSCARNEIHNMQALMRDDIKTIAELNQKINEAQTELELWRDGSIISEAHQKELDQKRHSDYKRCLAMARWCASRAVVWDIDGNEKKSEWYWKWKERWKELAEKCKPNY